MFKNLSMFTAGTVVGLFSILQVEATELRNQLRNRDLHYNMNIGIPYQQVEPNELMGIKTFNPRASRNQTERPSHVVRVFLLDRLFQSTEYLKKYRFHSLNLPKRGSSGSVLSDELHGEAMVELLAQTLLKSPWLNSFDGLKNISLTLVEIENLSEWKQTLESLKRETNSLVISNINWEIGHNFDGTGIYNDALTDLFRANPSITWIQAAGNSHKLNSRFKIQTLSEGEISLPGPNNSVILRCQPSETEPNDETAGCKVKIVASWGDWKSWSENSSRRGTDKDIDLYLFEQISGNDDPILLASSTMVQRRVVENPNESFFPREIIETQVPFGEFYIKAVNRSHNFSAEDQLEIRVQGTGATLHFCEASIATRRLQKNPFEVDLNTECMSEHFPMGFTEAKLAESLLAPADHPDVITVGAIDFALSGRSQKLQKPDVYTPSTVIIHTASGEVEYGGTSIAATRAGALAVMLKLTEPHIGPLEIKSRLSSRSGLSSDLLSYRFVYAGKGTDNSKNCVATKDLRDQFRGPFQRNLLWAAFEVQQVGTESQGALVVDTSEGPKMLVPFDPKVWLSNWSGVDDKTRYWITPSNGHFSSPIVTTSNGSSLYPQAKPSKTLYPQPTTSHLSSVTSMEVLQAPNDLRICGAQPTVARLR
ncbi:MAG: hypothetical protein COT74_01190 [Bdellovibrionales bacterium CG10_big_fil_rev_8_21_14_0_10_45_34]|nr:MAG: hypothetical protein COT74_01190 [Bdellovibrionales bacterium CG10_big_fil_rev_8_21_14_0_10_45_34]